MINIFDRFLVTEDAQDVGLLIFGADGTVTMDMTHDG